MSCSTTSKSRRKGSRPRLSKEGEGVWTAVEHARFLEAVEVYPRGPWKLVAAYIGTRSTRQAMTHAQKFRQKLERRRRGLRRPQPKRATSQPSVHPETLETADMLSFEHLLAADSGEAYLKDGSVLEPLPLRTAGFVEAAEPTWVDDCFAFFVDTFSC